MMYLSKFQNDEILLVPNFNQGKEIISRVDINAKEVDWLFNSNGENTCHYLLGVNNGQAIIRSS